MKLDIKRDAEIASTSKNHWSRNDNKDTGF